MLPTGATWQRNPSTKAEAGAEAMAHGGYSWSSRPCNCIGLMHRRWRVIETTHQEENDNACSIHCEREDGTEAYINFLHLFYLSCFSTHQLGISFFLTFFIAPSGTIACLPQRSCLVRATPNEL